MHKVFVSYSSKEANRANEIVKKLEAAGIPCWIAAKQMRVGGNHTEEIPIAIEQCTYFLLVLSANAQKSRWVPIELQHAISCGKEILPLKIDQCAISKAFGYQLGNSYICEYHAHPEKAINEIIRRIQSSSGCAAETYYQKGLLAYASKRYSDAVAWYQKAAESGHRVAQFDLGCCYDYGLGVKQNTSTAVKYYQLSAAQNYPHAQYNLAIYYMSRADSDYSQSRAAKLFKKAASQGHVSAQYSLGLCYEEGRGVGQSYRKAFDCYNNIAHLLPQACYRLGLYYDRGIYVACDTVKAVNCYKEAARSDYAEAQCKLGYCYETGRGVNQNQSKAVTWYQKAVAQNHPTAQYNLALCYHYGKGVRKNLHEARNLYQKAAAQGDTDAKAMLAVIK